jgi:O-antigen/teichoic acid export membrane protein
MPETDTEPIDLALRAPKNSRWSKWYATSVSLWGNIRFRQVLLLYAANLAGVPLALVTSIVFTRFLGPQGYGNFAFLDSIFDFGKTIFTLGFFYAGSRAIVLSNQPQKVREYYGSTLLILGVLFIIMSLFFAGYGLFDPNLNDKGLTNFFLMLIPFGWVFMLIPFFDTVLKADNRINTLATTRFLPKVVLFAGAISIYYFLPGFEGNRLTVVWGIYLMAFIIVFVLVLSRIQVSLKNSRQRIAEIWQQNKIFGLHIYTGGLFYAGSLSLTGIILSYYSHDNAGVGFLALALAISRPLELIPSAVATAYFRDFASQDSLNKRLASATLLLSLGGLVVTWALVGPFIRYFYSDDFIPVITLVFPISIAMVLHGLSGLLNRFLEARGKGKAIRNTYIATGITLVIANMLLIPQYGANGASIAMLISGIIYISVMIFYYLNRSQQPDHL